MKLQQFDDSSSQSEQPWPDRFKVQGADDAYKLGISRDPSGARLTKTGRTDLNAAGSELARNQIARHGASTNSCGVLWAADVPQMQIAGRIVGPDVPGVTPLRVNAKTGVVTLYLNWVFDANPKLRPASARWVSITEHTHPQKGDYFVVHCNLALRRNKTAKSEKGSDEKPADQAASQTKEPGKNAK